MFLAIIGVATSIAAALYSPLQCLTGSLSVSRRTCRTLSALPLDVGPTVASTVPILTTDVQMFPCMLPAACLWGSTLFLLASILHPALMCWIVSGVSWHYLHIGPCFWAFSASSYAVFQSGLSQPYSHDADLPFPDFSNRNCGIHLATHPRGHTSACPWLLFHPGEAYPHLTLLLHYTLQHCVPVYVHEKSIIEIRLPLFALF